MGKCYIEWSASLVDCFIVVRFLNRWLPFRHLNYKNCATGIIFILLAIDNIALSQKEGAENVSIIIMLLLISIYSPVLQKGSIYEKALEILIPTLTLFPVNGIVLYAVSFVANEDVNVLRSSAGELRILVLFFSKFAFFIICEVLIKLKRKESYSLLSFQWLLQILYYQIIRV